jgi:dolichol-phosphate mannosyltransferase
MLEEIQVTTALARLRAPAGAVRLLAFGAVGATGYVVNVGVFVAARAAGAPTLAASTLAFAVSAASNFALNTRWTFADVPRRPRVQAPRFLCVSLVALGATLLAVSALLGAGLSPLAAQICAIVGVTPLSFVLNRRWAFRPAAVAAWAPPAAEPLPGLRAMVVVPTYDEAENIEPLLTALGRVLGPRDRVLVVDDASPDGTGELADSLARKLGFVDVLHRPGKDGLGRAYVDGFRYALQRGARLVVEMDADLSHRPDDVPRLIAACDGAALAIGSRYVAGGSASGLSRRRQLLSRAGSAYARLLLGVRVRDLTDGFKCFRREALESVLARPLRSAGYAFQIETTYRVARAGLDVVEVPIAFADRRAGSSKMSAAIALEALVRVPSLRVEATLAALRASARSSAWSRIAVAWAGSRLVVLGSAYFAVHGGVVHLQHHAQTGRTLVGPLVAWDGRWYTMIASRGYYFLPGRQSDAAFFPLYPIALRLLHLTGASIAWGGVVLSNLVLLPALVLLYELVRTWLPEADARRAAIYAAFFPLGFVFSMLYPESLVLALVSASFVALVRRRYALATIAGALAALGRPEAAFVVLPAALVVRRAWPTLAPRARAYALAAAGAPLAGVLGFALYQAAVLHAGFAYESAQSAWGRRFGLLGVQRALGELRHAGRIHDEWLWRDAAFLGAYLACLVLARRARVPWPWLAAAALIVVLPVESGSFTSIGRFGLLALPVYAGLAYAGRHRAVDLAVKLASASLLAAFTILLPLHWP